MKKICAGFCLLWGVGALGITFQHVFAPPVACAKRFALASQRAPTTHQSNGVGRKFPPEPNSIALAYPELDAWAQERYFRAYGVSDRECLGVRSAHTRGEAYEGLKAALQEYFQALQSKNLELREALRAEGKSDDISDPRYIFARELQDLIFQHNALRTLLDTPIEGLPPVRLTPGGQRLVDSIKQHFLENQDQEFRWEESREFIHDRFAFMKHHWSEVAVFTCMEGGLHVSSDVYQLQDKTLIPLMPDLELHQLTHEFDVIGLRIQPVGAARSGHVVLVGEVKAGNQPLGLLFSDGTSVVDVLKTRREKARKAFSLPIEFRVYSTTGFTPELAAELRKLRIEMRPEPEGI